MKFNTHDRTLQPQESKITMIVLAVGVLLLYGIFVLCAVLCFAYAHNLVAGLLALGLPLVVAAIVFVIVRDMSLAYVEVGDGKITAADFVLGKKREKSFAFDQIDHVEILPSYSRRVQGRRWGLAGVRYIVFRGKSDEYLFKVIYIPETADFFSMYIK